MSMDNRDGKIWFDGELVNWRDAKVHVLTHSLHYGLAVFEGVRAYQTAQGTAIFRLQDHTQRLFESAHIMNLKIPFSPQQISEAQCWAVRENQLSEAYIRPLVFLGSQAMGLRAQGLKVHVAVAAWSWPSYMDAEAAERGIVVKTSSFTRHHVNISMCRAKASGHYINSSLALNEVLACGADEALLLDVDGFVAEGSSENIFVVKNGVIYTPELTSCLSGITRNTIMVLAAEQGLTVIEKRITRDEVYVADEAFFTGTAAEVVPIRELDHRCIGSGKRGPITEKMHRAYLTLVRGNNPTLSNWLTPVN